ncbi:unnamed protein product [Urochloa humidicola]
MATGALLSAAARRCPRPAASAIVRREVTGFHDLTIDGCAASRKFSKLEGAESQAFEAAGHSWRILFLPRGSLRTRGRGYMSIYLELVNGGAHLDDDPVEFKFTLLGHDGCPVPEFSRSREACFFGRWTPSWWNFKGFSDFIKWNDLEESGYLKDDRFTIRCDIKVTRDYTEDVDVDDDGAAAAAPARVVVPPSDLHDHLGGLPSREHGTMDVTIDDGGGVTYGAHGSLLAVRSPVFAAELLAAAGNKSGSDSVRGPIKVEGLEPRVLKALLHFIYTDRLPEMAAEDAVVMARGLLAAAARYKLERLKLMCEELLCDRIGVDTVAGNLAVARQHGCQSLAAMCMEFIAGPGNLKAVMETQEFHKIKASCPGLFIELLMKKLS